jgi:hypothetical protein
LKDLGNKPEQSHILVKNLWAQTDKKKRSCLAFRPAAA